MEMPDTATESAVQPAPRTKTVMGLALLQALAIWLFPKWPVYLLTPLLVTAPLAFYCSERYLPCRSWFPSLCMVIVWLGMAAYSFLRGNPWEPRLADLSNIAVYGVFCFFALPFIQTWTELGRKGMRPVAISARMNRNITLLLLGCLAVMPVCLVLAFGVGNIEWAFRGHVTDQFESWNPLTPFGFFALIIPCTFAGAIMWAQTGNRKDGQDMTEWPVLPFLRRTIGTISGFVALTAGLAMAGSMLGAAVRGSFFSLHTTVLSLVIAGFFWTAVSMSVREGRWQEKLPGSVLLSSRVFFSSPSI